MSVTCKCRVHSIDPNTFSRNPPKIGPIDRSTRHYYRFFNICKWRQAILISIQSFYLMPEPHGSKQSCGQMAEEYKVSFRHKKPRLLAQVSPGSCFQLNLISLILTNQKKVQTRCNAAFFGRPKTFVGGIRAEIRAIDGDHLCPPTLLPSGVSMGTKGTLCSAHAPYTRSQMRIIKTIKQYMKTGTGRNLLRLLLLKNLWKCAVNMTDCQDAINAQANSAL